MPYYTYLHITLQGHFLRFFKQNLQQRTYSKYLKYGNCYSILALLAAFRWPDKKKKHAELHCANAYVCLSNLCEAQIIIETCKYTFHLLLMESYIINIYMDIEKRFNANITYVRKYVMWKKIILWILLNCSNPKDLHTYKCYFCCVAMWSTFFVSQLMVPSCCSRTTTLMSFKEMKMKEKPRNYYSWVQTRAIFLHDLSCNALSLLQ